MPSQRCRCVPIKTGRGRVQFIDKSNCFVHSPDTAKHNARLDKLIAKASHKPEQLLSGQKTKASHDEQRTKRATNVSCL